jgi:hypothetical protein
MSSPIMSKCSVLPVLACAAALASAAPAASAAPGAGLLPALESQATASGLVERVLAVGTCGGKTCYVQAGKGVFGSIKFYCRPNPPCPTNCPKSGCSAR